MNFYFLGETAAILASCLWSLNSIFYVAAGKRLGSFNVNALRILMALGILGLVHLFLYESLLPAATSKQWLWIGVSGIVGLGIGDMSMIAAFLLIGPRRSALFTALSPVIASIGGFLLLGEMLSLPRFLGMAITLLGIIVVLLEKNESAGVTVSLNSWRLGIFLAFVGALSQGIASTLAKKGVYLTQGFVINPLSTALMRVIVGAIFMWIVSFIIGKSLALKNALMDTKGITYTAISALIGPFLGMTLAMVAITYTQTGVAQTLLSLSPVIIIPIVRILHKQKTSWLGIMGAIVAVLGVAIIFLT